MKAEILQHTGALNTIYTEDNSIIQKQEKDIDNEISVKNIEQNSREHRTVMSETYHSRSIGTGLGFGNICAR